MLRSLAIQNVIITFCIKVSVISIKNTSANGIVPAWFYVHLLHIKDAKDAHMFLCASFAHEDRLTGNVCDLWKFVFF